MSHYLGSQRTAPSLMSASYASRTTPSQRSFISSRTSTDKTIGSNSTRSVSSYSSRASTNSTVSRVSRNTDVYPTGTGAPERLAKARVLYLGTATTDPCLKGQGLGLIAKPVTERLPDDLKEVQAIDSWLFVHDNGVQIGYVTDHKFLVWIPMQNVHMVAAIKRKEIGQPAYFVPIDSPEAADAYSPPIFALVTQRSNGLMECHSFICTSDIAAMSLVKACTFAHGQKSKWTQYPPARDLLLANVDDAHDDLDDTTFEPHYVSPDVDEHSVMADLNDEPELGEASTQVAIPEGFDTGRVTKRRRQFQYRVRPETERRQYSPDRSDYRTEYRSRTSGSRTSGSRTTSGFRTSGDYRTTPSWTSRNTRDTRNQGDRWHRNFDVEIVRPAGQVGAPRQLDPWQLPEGGNVQPNYRPVPIRSAQPLMVYGAPAGPPQTPSYSYDSRAYGYSRY